MDYLQLLRLRLNLDPTLPDMGRSIELRKHGRTAVSIPGLRCPVVVADVVSGTGRCRLPRVWLGLPRFRDTGRACVPSWWVKGAAGIGNADATAGSALDATRRHMSTISATTSSSPVTPPR